LTFNGGDLGFYLLCGRFVFVEKVVQDVVEFDLVLVPIEESALNSEHGHPELFVLGFPLAAAIVRVRPTAAAAACFTPRVA